MTNTAAKRAAAAQAGLSPGLVLPIPDGTVGAADRAQLAGVYFVDPNSPPALLGQIPDIAASLGTGSHAYDLSAYFANAVTYAIAPALEAGWAFDVNTGILTIDTDDEDTFGPFTVTATNANGDTASNAFDVAVTAFTGYVGGTAIDAVGVMTCHFLNDATAVPAGAIHRNGFAHTQAGARYVALWPGSGIVYYDGKIARRGDGAMVIVVGGAPIGYQYAYGLTARGEVVVSTNTPQVVNGSLGMRQDGSLCVSEAA